MPPPRMTANPKLPARHRAGKPGAAIAQSSSEEESEESEKEEPQEKQIQTQKPRPKPVASSFPSGEKNVKTSLNDVRLTETERKKIEDEFETESEEEEVEADEESEEGSGSEEESSEEEESSSEDERARMRLKPVFVKKDQRKATESISQTQTGSIINEERKKAEEEAQRRARTDTMIQDQLEKDAAAKAEQKAYWDEEILPQDALDDTDGLDPEAELTAWKLRELRRVKRERDAIIAAEKEREEIERRRNLTVEEREAEDKEFLEAQKAEREGRGQMSFLQRYQHKGAFFTDDLKESGLAGRDVMGGRYADDVSDRAALPEYMQIRDMTKLGRKGRTRYRDMKTEDTGRFGDFGPRKPRYAEQDDGFDTRGLDDRFKPDDDRGFGATGANASTLGDRKRPGTEQNDRDEKRTKVD